MNHSGCVDNAIGMMDGAYFTGRKEILEFLNNLLLLNLTKIEECASGAVACQLIEYIYPGCILMKRVNWEAKSDYEYVQNYKLLQAAFDKKRIRKYIDVDKLIRAKYQDNLEFCQWLKAFFDQAAPYREDYNPIAVRSKGKGGKNISKKDRNVSQRHRTAAVPSKRVTRNSEPNKSKGVSPRLKNASKGKENISSRPPSHLKGGLSESIVADAKLMKINADLMNQKSKLELTLVDAEKERDFFFEKLRDIEMVIQIHQEKGSDARDPDTIIEHITKILYAADDDEQEHLEVEGTNVMDGSDILRCELESANEEEGLMETLICDDE